MSFEALTNSIPSKAVIRLVFAAGLFGDIKEVHEFANFVQPLVENWRIYTRDYWCKLLCAITGQISGREAAMLTASLLVGLLFIVDPAPPTEAQKPPTKDCAAESPGGSLGSIYSHVIEIRIPPWLKVRKLLPEDDGTTSPVGEFWTVYWHAIPIAILAWLIVFPVFGGTPTPSPLTLAKWASESFVVFLLTFAVGQTIAIVYRGAIPNSIDEAARQIGTRATMVLSIIAVLWGINLVLVSYGKQIEALIP